MSDLNLITELMTERAARTLAEAAQAALQAQLETTQDQLAQVTAELLQLQQQQPNPTP